MAQEIGRVPRELWGAQGSAVRYDGTCRGTPDGALERKLERQLPAIAWRTPWRVERRGVAGWACRYCIAIYGTAEGGPETLRHLPATEEAAHAMIHAAHCKDDSP